MAPITTILAFLLPVVDVGVVAFTPQKQSFSSSSPVSPMTPHNKKRTSFGLQVFEPSAQFDATSLIGDAGKVQHSKRPAVASSGGPRIKIVPRQAEERKKWGVDNAHAQEYWFDDRIHTLGNTGLGGALHAALAPISTKCIDQFAYDGVDIRAKVARILSDTLGQSRANVMDLCCGVGISTRALHDAFPDAEKVVGLDTSPQMIAMASFLDWHVRFFRPLVALVSDQVSTAVTTVSTYFERGNAERTKHEDRSFDLVTIMYAFHEVPKEGRDRILAEAHRLLRPGGTLCVLDISQDYTPSLNMILGEPYVLEYQKSIDNQIKRFRGFLRPRYKDVVPGHVGMWLLQRA